MKIYIIKLSYNYPVDIYTYLFIGILLNFKHYFLNKITKNGSSGTQFLEMPH
jgi:hypothetical protein